jgi:hypothetical protein
MSNDRLPGAASGTRDGSTDGELSRRDLLTSSAAGLAAGAVAGASLSGAALADDFGRRHHGRGRRPIILQDQGSFMVGGTVVTNSGTFDPIALTPDGQTIHGDHAYVQYQIPRHPRELPLVMWHGGGQFSKTWESTPDGRDGFQNIFIRRSFATYILDQPRRGRAGRTTVGTTLTPVPGPGATGEQGIFIRFRLGIWPDLFPGVQFSSDPPALEQWWRQQTPNTGPGDNDVMSDAVVALFDQIGPAVLLTHSASGLPGWLTAVGSEDVKAVVSYEPVGWAFPEGEVPAPMPTAGGDVSGSAIPLADFEKLTEIPIQIVYGDNVPSSPDAFPGLDIWRARLAMSALFVDAVNARGGDAEMLHLPEVGVFGNTHFPMSDLNNLEVADLLSQYLRDKDLDRRRAGDKKDD